MKSSASRSPRSRSSTCRCPARRRLRLKRSTRIRSRCRGPSKFLVSRRSRSSSAQSSSIRRSRWHTRSSPAYTEHRTRQRAGAAVFTACVRAARPRERARAVLHLVALLPGRDAGLGEGARAGAGVGEDVSTGGVRVQQPRRGRHSPRTGMTSRSRRFASRSASIRNSSRPMETWLPR